MMLDTIDTQHLTQRLVSGAKWWLASAMRGAQRTMALVLVLGLMMMKWGADWPTGFGFLQQIIDGRAIKPSGGTNLQETNLPEVNKLFDDVASNPDVNARNGIYTKVDQLVMEDAGIVPLVYASQLLYRPANVTNVMVTAALSGQYDYLNMGVK